MKRLLPLALAILLVLPGIAFANADNENEPAIQMGVKVIDTDPKGTNVRDAPKGKIIHVIPFNAADDSDRVVWVVGQDKDWFKVELEDGSAGWMHTSVLGLRGGATEDGPCDLLSAADYKSKVVVTPKDGAVLQLLDVRTPEWIKVRYIVSKGKTYDGWMPEQCQ